MDRQTKQWIVDRVIWVLGLTLAVLVMAPAFAGGGDGRRVQVSTSSAPDLCIVRGHIGMEA